VRYSTAARFSASSRSAWRQIARDVFRLVEVVAGAVVQDRRAAGLLRVQALLLAVLVLGDHRRGRVENDLRGPVVALEAHHHGLGKVVLEIEDVAQVGAAPLVDRLVGVAHDREIAVESTPGAESAGTAGGWCPDTRPP
jgi:hypothetical protein